MTKPNPFALFFAGLLAFFALAAVPQACAGAAARSNTLLPAMQAAWPPVRAGVEREVAAQAHTTGAAALAQADAALSAGVAVQVAAVDWPLLELLADQDVARRVAAGEVGEGVAVSLRERLARFHDARLAFVRSQ